MSSHPTLSLAEAVRTGIAEFALLSFYTTLQMAKMQLLVEKLYIRCMRDASKNPHFHISCLDIGDVVLKLCR